MKAMITENGLNYALVGDYYFPLLTLPKEDRPIGYWGRKHLDYIREHHPILFNQLALGGKLQTYLADLNEQAQDMAVYDLRDFFHGNFRLVDIKALVNILFDLVNDSFLSLPADYFAHKG